jgi:hypothetical protein
VTIRASASKATFTTDYSERMIVDPTGIIQDMRAALRGVKYDTIVGRGSSGMLIVPVVARALRKNFFIVRKIEEVESSHSGQRYLGHLGKRWVFLDDFTSSGNTFRKTRDGVKDAVRDARIYDPSFGTELVGYFEYEKAERGFTPWDENVRPGYSDSYMDDTPGWAKIQEQRERERAESQRAAERYRTMLRERDDERAATRRAERAGLITQAVTVEPVPTVGPGCGVANCIVCSDVMTKTAYEPYPTIINRADDLKVKVTGL